jgi:hypothetical protein
MPNHLDPPPKVLLDPALTAAGVALVDPQVLDAGEVIGDSLQQQGHGSAILNISRVHSRSQHEPLAIYENVAFAAIDAFGAIVAADAANPGRPDRLTVDDASGRLRVTPNTSTELFAQHLVDMLPGAVYTPEPKVVVGGLPGWELVRQQPPGTATSDDVEDGVQDLAHRMKPWSADTLGRRQERIQAGELSICQIG